MGFDTEIYRIVDSRTKVLESEVNLKHMQKRVVEKQLKENFEGVSDVVVHIEPANKD